MGDKSELEHQRTRLTPAEMASVTPEHTRTHTHTLFFYSAKKAHNIHGGWGVLEGCEKFTPSSNSKVWKHVMYGPTGIIMH